MAPKNGFEGGAEGVFSFSFPIWYELAVTGLAYSA